MTNQTQDETGAYVVIYGKSDNSRVKQSSFTRRALALKLANKLAFVLWGEHSFKISTTENKRVEGNGFFVEFKDVSPAQLKYKGSSEVVH